METQQTSDRTYRMFDYGRPRQLHVEQGIGVTKLATRAGKVAPRRMDGYTRLIEERYFSVDRFDVEGGSVRVAMDGPGCLVGLEGEATVRSAAGEAVTLARASAVVVPAGTEVVVQAAGRVSFARCTAPR